MLHVWELGEAYTGFLWGNLRERDYLGDPGVDGRIILRSGMWGMDWSSWLWIGTGGKHL